MFTGLVQTIATIQARQDSYLDITCPDFLGKMNLGDSIAISGVCLTVAQFLPTGFRADISPETYTKTNLSDSQLTYVNLEMSLKVGDRLGGHFVSGHVDTVGTVVEAINLQDSWEFTFRVSGHIGKYLIYKGSVAINGISLTIAKCIDKSDCVEFITAVIPHTYSNTNLKFLQVGDRVNVEADMLGKYVERILRNRLDQSAEPITEKFLLEHGWV